MTFVPDTTTAELVPRKQFDAALASRTTIGIAIGVLMVIYGMDQDAALEYMKRLSNDGHLKLAVVAAEIVALRGSLNGQNGDRSEHRGPVPGPRRRR